MLARLHWGGGPVPVEHAWLHAHLQIFGFFGTLIVGVAHHLVPRFAGRPVAVTPLTRWLVAALGAALALRIAGTAAGTAGPMVAAALLQALAFGLFGAWVARALGAPHLRLTRTHLTVATAWLVAALVLEAGLRAWAAADGGPDVGGMRAAHAMADLRGRRGMDRRRRAEGRADARPTMESAPRRGPDDPVGARTGCRPRGGGPRRALVRWDAGGPRAGGGGPCPGDGRHGRPERRRLPARPGRPAALGSGRARDATRPDGDARGGRCRGADRRAPRSSPGRQSR